FGCNLISDGTNEFNYGENYLKNMFSNIGGLSFGNQSDNIICWKDNDIPSQNSKLVIKPYPIPENLTLNIDGVIYGIPGDYSNYPFRVRVTDSNKVSDTKTYYLTTDIHDINIAENAVNIFPNPVLDNISISINENDLEILEICLYDVAGKILKKIVSSSSNDIILDMSEYKSGSYHIKIITTKGSFVKDIVKI
ncbi:MAG: T9SS type A sorting domain-containing protein, partial [Bacteroidales bacterium]|nr:T9SS type A sorting domain-containing protein [Bacteroidales bacterium]